LIYLLLSIFCSALIGNLLILFDRDKKADILIIFLGNYFLASIFSLFFLKTSISELHKFDIGLGMITGVFFLINFILYRNNIQLNGLSLSVSIMRISLLIPTAISLIFFGDRISLFNYLGIIIILFAFIFVTELRSYRNFLLLLLLFTITGLSDTSLKIY